ncbi:magnesium transporter CorA family protein [Brevundimonas sp.]|uniref:magnesium transporter CorA family protein n=1 Tax=Brevundimonas sp. TaxID=1871086 RepID=UPI003D6CD31D
MIRLYRRGSQACELLPPSPQDLRLDPDLLWIDLLSPTRDEELAIERAVNLALPTREEMSELEASSRLYREDGASFVTADLIARGDEDIPAIGPVTFVLTSGPLITIRYFNPRPFSIMDDKLSREPNLCGSGADVFLNLMEAVIDRASDVLSHNVEKVEAVAGHVFADKKSVGFEKLIAKLGRAHIANARIEQSLAGLSRVFAFVALNDRLVKDKEAREHLKSLARDAQSLIVHNQSVAAGINFQLSAALGLINIEQSSIIKIFSVAAVAFMPPTLIASIYGMNFDHMPELPQVWGYPAALVAMVVAAVLPLAWFKKKGWL